MSRFIAPHCCCHWMSMSMMTMKSYPAAVGLANPQEQPVQTCLHLAFVPLHCCCTGILRSFFRIWVPSDGLFWNFLLLFLLLLQCRGKNQSAQIIYLKRTPTCKNCSLAIQRFAPHCCCRSLMMMMMNQKTGLAALKLSWVLAELELAVSWAQQGLPVYCKTEMINLFAPLALEWLGEKSWWCTSQTAWLFVSLSSETKDLQSTTWGWENFFWCWTSSKILSAPSSQALQPLRMQAPAGMTANKGRE